MHHAENTRVAACDTRLGLSYLRAGEVDRAHHKLQQAVQAAPHDPDSLSAMAYYYAYLKENTLATQWYQRAVQMAPCGQTHHNYAVFLCQQGDYPQAMAQFYLALEDKHYLPDKVYENAGLCALSQGDHAVAKPLLKKALAYHPHNAFLQKVVNEGSA